MTNSKEILANNIKNLLKMQGFSREMVAEGIGVKYTTFCDWAKGRTYPKMEYIKETSVKSVLQKQTTKESIVTISCFVFIWQRVLWYDDRRIQ